MSFLKSLAKSEPYRETAPTPSVTNIIVRQPSPPALSSVRRSQIFDSHLMSEAQQNNKRGRGKMPQAVSLAWDERGRWGFDIAPKSWTGMTPMERKETLLQIYLANPWASSCIETIGLYIVSGEFVIEPRPGVENPDKRQHDQIEEFLMRINQDWDFNEYVYDGITDELIFGETFTEFTMRDGLPYELFPTDCITMDTEFDPYGRITRFKQQLNSTTKINWLDPKTIVRWWLPHKRAKVDPCSPLERMQDTIYLDKQMVNWQTTFFRKGGKFPFYFEGLPNQEEADRYLAWFKENYTGAKNAHGIPATWGNTKISPLGGNGPMNMDFDKSLDRTQAIVLATLHVPPSVACISEIGNRLTDMSDSQRKILEFITCNPYKRRFFQKFNYNFIYPYFGRDYRVGMTYANFRNDEEVAKMEDMRIRNGSLLIDEARQDTGREPYSDGSGAIPIIITTKEVLPVPRTLDLEQEQKDTAQAALDTAQANADLAKEKVKQARKPPEPVPTALQQAQQSNEPDTDAKKPEDKQEAVIRPRFLEEGQRLGGLCLKK